MRLTCLRNKLEFQKNSGILSWMQSETQPLELPLTVGKQYEVQVICRLDRSSIGTYLETNGFQGEKLTLLVFTDNVIWEEIEIPYTFVPDELRRLSMPNCLLKSIFENPS